MQIKIGDTIKFKAATRSGYRAATRKVKGFWQDGPLPTVGYDGWAHFVVRLNEIIEVNGETYE